MFADQIVELRERLASGEDLSDLNYLDVIEFEDLQVDDREPLRLQAEDFLSAVRNGTPPEIDAEAGSLAVQVAERIIESARGGQLSLA